MLDAIIQLKLRTLEKAKKHGDIRYGCPEMRGADENREQRFSGTVAYILSKYRGSFDRCYAGFEGV